ncbi:MAG TPA: hypothetical protein VFL41_12175 [Gaiellaceae bacterium]|nr:hypothetical protein [Gaiellaceae bacterium]
MADRANGNQVERRLQRTRDLDFNWTRVRLRRLPVQSREPSSARVARQLPARLRLLFGPSLVDSVRIGDRSEHSFPHQPLREALLVGQQCSVMGDIRILEHDRSPPSC